MSLRRVAPLALPLFLAASPAAAETPTKPWCSPDVSELSDHVCYADGSDGAERKTLIVYMHGMYATTPGFQHLQQSALAKMAKAHKATILFPTAPRTSGGYVWPTGQAAQKEHEAALLAGIVEAKGALEKKLGRTFDETFVVGFSSGAYYASSVAIRGVFDADGFLIVVGGSSWARPSESPKRPPIFVGVSAADKQTASHTRAFAGTLAALRWPYRVEERDVGHTVDPTMFARGLAWLRAQKSKS